MFNDDRAINALMRWAALAHSAEAEARLDLPSHQDTARRAERAYRGALDVLKARGIFKSGHAFTLARHAFAAHLELRKEIAEQDPAQRVWRSILRAGAFTWFLSSQRKSGGHDQAHH